MKYGQREIEWFWDDSPNRTTLELKLMNNDKFIKAIDSQSHHAGIEMQTIIEIQSELIATNRTTLELK